MTSKQMKLFVALAALAAAACSVNESGKVKCADDFSCPNDYPVCSGGFCIEGTSTSRNSVAVLGVPGKNSTDPLRGAVTVQVTARATTGVKSVTLKSTSQSFTAPASATGPVYDIAVDTTKLTDGPVQLTATLVTGDDTTLDSAAKTFTIDNTPPALNGTVTVANSSTGQTLGTILAKAQQQVQFSGASTESLATVSVTSASGNGACSVTGAQFTCLLTVSATTSGAATATLTLTDLAGNQASGLATPGFTLDNTLPAFTAGLTITNVATTQSTDPVAVRSGQVLAITGTATKALAGASIASTAGTGACSASGTAVSCSLTITSTSSSAATATITLVDVVGNTSAGINTQNFTLDNVTPAFSSAISVTNTTTGLSMNPVAVAGGQILSFQGAANKPIATADISSAFAGGQCLPSGSSVTCTLTVPTSATTSNSGAASIVLTDALGATSGPIPTPAFIVDNSAPTVLPPVSSDLTGQALPGTTVLITFTLTDANAGIDKSVPPTVKVGAASATVTPQTPGTVTTPVSYSATYVFTGTETAGSSVAVTVGFTDSVGNAGTDSTLALQTDLVPPSIVSSPAPAYSRTPGSGATVTGSATLTAGNGTTTIYVFDTLANAQAATTVAAANSSSAASTTVTGAGTQSFVASIADGAVAQALGVAYVRAFSRGGLSSNIQKSAGTTLNMNYLALTGTNLNKGFSVRTLGTAQPTIPISAPSSQTDVTSTVQSGGAIADVGSFQTVSPANPLNAPPLPRIRAQVAFNPVTHKLVVAGGVNRTNGRQLNDGNAYVLDLSTTPSWLAPVGGGAPINSGCTFAANHTRFDATFVWSTSRNKYIVHGGRCFDNAITPVNVQLNEYLEADVEGGSPSWSSLGAGGTPKAGAQGGMLAFVNTSGNLSDSLFNFGVNENSGSQTTQTLEKVTSLATTPAYALATGQTSSNRVGAGFAPDDTAQNAALIFGGLSVSNTNLHLGGGQNDLLSWDGTTLSPVTTSGGPPLARGYAAMAMQTFTTTSPFSGSPSVLLYGGTASECNVSLQLTRPSWGTTGNDADCASATAFDDLWELSVGSTHAWSRVHVNVADAAGALNRTAAENGASVNGFVDGSTFYVYRPAVGLVHAFPLFHSPRVLLVFDAHNEASLTSGAITELVLRLTASALINSTGSPASNPPKISLWNGSTWTDVTSQFSAGVLTLTPASTPSATSVLVGGIVSVLVEPSTLSSDFNFKSVIISPAGGPPASPSLTWTTSTP